MVGAAGLAGAAAAPALSAPAAGSPRWVSTSRAAAWSDRSTSLSKLAAGPTLEADVALLSDQTFQTIEGFGACFNELGATALARLSATDRAAVLREFFSPEGGLGLTYCRMPVGANDFSTDWYSYNEIAGDFAMANFSIAKDREHLLPFVKSALALQPNLKLWASPWSPPTWMKRNKHYAMRPNSPGWPANNLRPDQAGREGEDMFIQEEAYFRAYALYFSKFIEAYRAEGVKISMVMPQNEFNSVQPFPSCCWTPEGLARFIPYLGAEMGPAGVEIFFGTLERGDPLLLEKVLQDPQAGPLIRGVGAQWAGKNAVTPIHYLHPDLKLFQTEQECGDGKNDWRYARYTWTLMKTYFGAGASVYQYWNMALLDGGVSRWGWAQNSLVTVDGTRQTLRYTNDYYVFKHLSHFVKPGAVRIRALSYTGYENMLAFKNPDGSTIVVVQNDLSTDLPVKFGLDGAVYAATLPADSFNTLVL